MATPNQVAVNFENNAILNALNRPDKSSVVYDLSGGYNFIDTIVTKNTSPRSVNGLEGKFEKPIIGRSDTGTLVAATPTLSGTNLVVVFSDPTFLGYRETEVISDGTAANNQGRVVSVSPGTVTLEPVGGATTMATTQFPAGSYAARMFQLSINRGSTGITSLYEDPFYVYNYTSISRDSVDFFRRDFFQTYPLYNGKYWMYAQEKVMMDRFARGIERKALLGKRGQNVTTASGGGKFNSSQGLRDAILDPDRGGTYLSLSNVITQGQFEAFLGQIADRKNSSKYKIQLGVGRGALNAIQNFVRPYIQYAGSQNTFGGQSVKGVDVMYYAVNGIEVEMAMIPLFNDREQFPGMSTIPGTAAFTRMQYTMIAFDMDNYPTKGGGVAPAMEKVYFGNEEMVYGYLPGMVGSAAQQMASGEFRTSGNIAVSDRDGSSIQLYSDFAFDFMPYRMGWAEMSS